MPISRSFAAEVMADPDGSSMTALPVPFEPREVFGKARPPVVVSIGKHSFRSTICNMGSGHFVPLRRSNREAAGVAAGQRVTITLTLDETPRTVTPPRDLLTALGKACALAKWNAMSFTHQREHAEAIESAKKPETRQRRIAKCVEMVLTRPEPSASITQERERKPKLTPASRATSKPVSPTPVKPVAARLARARKPT